MKNKNVIISYLFTKFDKKASLIKFLNSYQKYKPGVKHNLVICFKLMDKREIENITKKINKKYKFKKVIYVDPNNQNDFDFGTYYRVAKNHRNKIIFFLNSHSIIEKKNWLEKILKFSKSKTLIGVTSSFSSHASNSFYRNKDENFFQFLKRFFLSNYYFNYFPNPHIRTACFLVNSNEFINFMSNSRTIESKFDAHILESGKSGLTNYFLKRNFNVIIVNSDANKFSLINSKNSDTFSVNDQSKLLISDKHSRIYKNSKAKQKMKITKRVWGN